MIVYNMVLSNSRRQFNLPSRDETAASIYEAFEEAFRHFGGVPKHRYTLAIKLLLPCTTLSFATPCRFIPALSKPKAYGPIK